MKHDQSLLQSTIVIYDTYINVIIQYGSNCIVGINMKS